MDLGSQIYTVFFTHWGKRLQASTVLDSRVMVKANVCKSMNFSRFYPLISNKTNYTFLHLHKIVKGFDIGALHSNILFLDLVHCVVL